MAPMATQMSAIPTLRAALAPMLKLSSWPVLRFPGVSRAAAARAAKGNVVDKGHNGWWKGMIDRYVAPLIEAPPSSFTVGCPGDRRKVSLVCRQ